MDEDESEGNPPPYILRRGSFEGGSSTLPLTGRRGLTTTETFP